MKHWCYGSGMIGCLYDNGPHFAETLEEALDGVLWPFTNTGNEEDLTEVEEQEIREALTSDGIYYFTDPVRFGAHFVQVGELDGPCPVEH